MAILTAIVARARYNVPNGSVSPLMSRMMSRRFQYFVWALLVLALVGYVTYKVKTSKEWQGFDFAQFQASASHLDVRYLLIALVLIYSTYLLRSLRWREFLLPVKTTSVSNLLASTVIGFGGLALLGRPGELLRPYLISRKEDMPITTQMAVWVLERVYDLAMVIFIVAGAMTLASRGDAVRSSGSPALAHLRTGGVTIMGITACGIVALALFRRYWETWSPQITRIFPRRFQPAVRNVIDEFGQGLASLRSARAFAMGLLYTVLIWVSISIGFYLTLHAFGSPLSDLSFSAAVLVMGFAIGGSMLQIPGIGGGSQVFTIVALTEIFAIRPEIATSAAIILWLLTFVAVVPAALVLLFREGLSLRKLRLMAVPEQARS